MYHSNLSNEVIDLDFKCSSSFDDTALIIISQAYLNLVHLDVFNNGGLTDHSITKIAKKCNKLQFLDIGCGGDILVNHSVKLHGHAMG